MASGPDPEGTVARGHALAHGAGSGPALVIEPVGLWGGVSAEDGRIIDVHHPACGRSIVGAVVVMRHGRGSSSASAILAETLRLGTGPAAIVLRSPDAILAVGSVVAHELYGVTCPVVELDEGGFAAVAALDGALLAVSAGPAGAIVAEVGSGS